MTSPCQNVSVSPLFTATCRRFAVLQVRRERLRSLILLESTPKISWDLASTAVKTGAINICTVNINFFTPFLEQQLCRFWACLLSEVLEGVRLQSSTTLTSAPARNLKRTFFAALPPASRVQSCSPVSVLQAHIPFGVED